MSRDFRTQEQFRVETRSWKSRLLSVCCSTVSSFVSVSTNPRCFTQSLQLKKKRKHRFTITLLPVTSVPFRAPKYNALETLPSTVSCFLETATQKIHNYLTPLRSFIVCTGKHFPKPSRTFQHTPAQRSLQGVTKS